VVLALGAAVALAVFWPRVVAGARIVGMKLGASKSVDDRVEQFGPAVRARLMPAFDAAGVGFPPRRVLLVAFKREMRLEMYASGSVAVGSDADDPDVADPDVAEPDVADPDVAEPDVADPEAVGSEAVGAEARGAEVAGSEARGWDGLRHVKSWRVLGASGDVGPKLREGDRQVPEGVYAIESLNPMSRFHLALRVAYPNDFDRARGAEDGRTELGSDIMVHGSDVSVGCLAMGDEGAEELFVVAALVGVENVSILISPCDLRVEPDAKPPADTPPWTAALWAEIGASLRLLPAR
jgi:hypothetical protein